MSGCRLASRSLSRGAAPIQMPPAARMGRAGGTLLRTHAVVGLLIPTPPDHRGTAPRSPAVVALRGHRGSRVRMYCVAPRTLEARDPGRSEPGFFRLQGHHGPPE